MTSNINIISLVVITHNYNDRYCSSVVCTKLFGMQIERLYAARKGPHNHVTSLYRYLSVSNRFTVISVMKGIVRGRYISPHPTEKLHRLTSKTSYTITY